MNGDRSDSDGDAAKYSLIIIFKSIFARSVGYIQQLHDLFARRGESFEIIVISQSANQILLKALSEMTLSQASVAVYTLNARAPQGTFLQAGIHKSRGDIVVVTECGMQITNESFESVLDELDRGADMVCPWRQQRVDSRFNRIQSLWFNRMMRLLIRSPLHDNSCTIKAFRREVADGVPLYGRGDRFMPIYAAWRGFAIKEVPCEHARQQYQSGVHGLMHYFHLMTDVITLFFNTWFTRKPLRLFSALGLAVFSGGFLMSAVVFLQKVFWGMPLGERPSLIISLLLVVLGVQIGSIGLLGELIAFVYGRSKTEYTIQKII